MKKHRALFVATVIIVYTMVLDFRFFRVVNRIRADQANPQITLPDASSVHRRESDRFPGAVLDFAADNSVYMGGKRMSDGDLKNFLLANPRIRVELRCARTTKYSKVKALVFKIRGWGAKDISYVVVESRSQGEDAVPDGSTRDYPRGSIDSGQ